MAVIYKKGDLIEIEEEFGLIYIKIGWCSNGEWGRLDYPLSKEEAIRRLRELKEAIEEAIQKLESL